MSSKAETVVVATEVTPVVMGGSSYGRVPYDEAPTSTSTGHWRDGLCHCCTLGCCHPSLCCAWCCPQLLMGQVLTRMKLSWLGNPTSAWNHTFKRVVMVVVIYFILSSYLSPPPIVMVENDDDEIGYENDPLSGVAEGDDEYYYYPEWKRQCYNFVSFAFGVYSLVVMIKLRSYIRSQSQIPESIVCEDCCCVFFCGCCTVAQMARHTANYEEIEETQGICCTGTCCSSTGLPEQGGSSNGQGETTPMIPAVVI